MPVIYARSKSRSVSKRKRSTSSGKFDKKKFIKSIISAVAGPEAAAVASFAMDNKEALSSAGGIVGDFIRGRSRTRTDISMKAPDSSPSDGKGKQVGMTPHKGVVTRYYRKGQRGYSGSNFKKPKKFTADPYLSKGVVWRQENGGNVSYPNGETAVLGHSTAVPYSSAALVFLCIVKELFRQDGQEIESWDKLPTLPTVTYVIQFSFHPTDESVVETVFNTGAITASTTYWDIGFLCRTAFQGVLSDTVQTKPRFVKCRLLDAVTADVKGEIAFDQFRIEFHNTSKIDFQNVTLAGDLVNTDLTIDVTNNPLVGKCYMANHSNGFYPRVRESSDASYKPFVCDPYNGLISLNSVDSCPNYIKEPPGGEYFKKCSKVVGVHLAPGEIKKSVISYHRKMSFHTFVRLFDIFLRVTPSVNLIVPFGNTKMYLFEKRLNNRSETTPISVDWEYNNTFRARYTYSKKKVITAMKQEIN